MRPALLRISIAYILLFFISDRIFAQAGFTGLNGTVINLPCNQNCVNVPVRIPHLKQTSDYIIATIPYNPYPYTTPTVILLPHRYTPTISIASRIICNSRFASMIRFSQNLFLAQMVL